MRKKNLVVIAEIANAHQGSVKEAISLYESSKNSGANAVKFQIYTAQELLVKNHTRFEHFEKQSFSEKDWRYIFSEINSDEIEVYADIFGLDSLKIANQNKLDGIKVHSSDLGNMHLLEEIKKYKGKIFISAGGSTAPELVTFINPLLEAGNSKELILMHGFQTYPTPVHESNLNKIFFLKTLFGDQIKYGYMDHIDAASPLASSVPLSLVSLGIEYIEKHVTHNRDRKGVDYYSSFEPHELEEFIISSKNILQAYGDNKVFFSDSERAYRNQVKKAYVWARDLNPGRKIKKEDIVMKRVEGSIPSIQYKNIIGKKLKFKVSIEEQITKNQLRQKILALVVVRTKSTRLANKALKKISNDESIIHLLKRLDIAKEFSFLDEIAVCTTTSHSDDELAKLINSRGYKVFRGSEENVLNRMMLAIQEFHDSEIILRITGDDILIDPYYLNQTVEEFQKNNSDYTDAKDLPSGTEVEVFSRGLLNFIHRYFEDTSGTEYLTNYFDAVKDHFNSSSLRLDKSFEDLRLTLDTQEDFDVISELIDFFDKNNKKYSYSIKDIEEYFSKFPEKKLINSTVKQRAIPKKFNTSVNWQSFTKRPLVTVYITCFNYGKYVEQAIHSVLEQNFNDFELIIIDDGSEDESRQIIERFKTHPKVKIIFQNNKGLNRSNNVAVKIASGDYIIRLDADDYLDPNALHFLTKKIEEKPSCALVFPDYFLVDEEGRILSQERRHNFDQDVEIYDQPAHGACTMFRKSVLKEIGMYSEKYDRQDGYEIWTKITNKYDVTNVNLPLFYYRQHEKSLTGNEDQLLLTRSEILLNLSEESSNPDTLAIIPIRKDSNDPSTAIRAFSESNLLEMLILKLQSSRRINEIVVSTNDQSVVDYLEKKNYSGITIHKRDDSISAINTPLELTVNDILDFYPNFIETTKFFTILHYEYPFLDISNIENSLNIMSIYNANSSMSVLACDTNFYEHDGRGLQPLSNNSKLRLERDQIFQEIGGIHSFRLDWYLNNPSLQSDKTTHLIIDNLSSKKIKSEEDFISLEFLFRKRQ